MVVITPNPLARNYSAIHQTGGVINMPGRTVRTRKVTAGKNKGRSVFASARNKRGVKETAGKAYKIKIPARPYLVIPPEDFPRIMSVVEGKIKGRIS
ncbi:MAG: phage virion morphogenesis protein [Ignavibacteriae bacterium]|nr:phage virion morphogenesis protein [Ignavibacteriota bacterium]